jgi:hypothetical protein
MLPGGWLAAILSVCAVASFAQVGPPPQKLPVVKSGEIPFYPPLLRIAQVEGEVDLRVKTDGSNVVSIVVDFGNLLLAKAAQDNVRTWKFEKHEPTVFSTVFSYHLDKDLVTYCCDRDKPDNGTVVLRLPAQVDITSHLRIRDCHDPDEGLNLSEPLRVFLSKCEVDGLSVACEKFTFRLSSGNLTTIPVRFKDNENKQGFAVPPEFRTLKNFSVNVGAGSGSFVLTNMDIGFLKGKWHVGIDHAPLKENTPVYGTAATLQCVGFIHFEWGEPEAVTWAPCK